MKCIVVLGVLTLALLAGSLVCPPQSGLQGISVGAALLAINVAALIGIRPKKGNS